VCQGFKIVLICVDFEVSIHKANKNIWPETLIKWCWFHLGKCGGKKMQDLGLVKEYGANRGIGNYATICHLFLDYRVIESRGS